MRVVALLVCAWLATSLGCASPRERLYTLSGPEPPAMTADATLHVVLGPVTIPAAVDRPQLMVRQSAVRLVALEQERWAEPLREAVPRVLADSMRSQLRNASVTGVSTAQLRADMRIIVEVTRFEAIAGQEVIIEAHWWLRTVGTKSGTEGASVARMTVQGGPHDYDAIVAAAAAALMEIGTDLSRAVEKEVAHMADSPRARTSDRPAIRMSV